MISTEAENTLPHRDPFLWVTRLMKRELKNGLGVEGEVELDLDPANPLFKGHFPGDPVFPGVLQIEAAAQACLWILLGHQEKGADVPDGLLVSVDGFKFKGIVIPPGTLKIRCKQLKVKTWLQYWEAELTYEDKLASKGNFWLGLNPPSRKAEKK